MNGIVWAAQLVLAAAFAAHGWLLLFPPASVVEQMNATLPRWFQLFLGGAEVAAAVGLIVPALTGIRPVLVPLAAAGIITVMVAATGLHLVRGEWSSALVTFGLLLLATFVAHQRWRVRPIAPRG